MTGPLPEVCRYGVHTATASVLCSFLEMVAAEHLMTLAVKTWTTNICALEFVLFTFVLSSFSLSFLSFDDVKTLRT